ncbi:hypothetical protein DPMN_004850 [Dreissena polymorpha]|uniref:HECT-type E3 ubiquitin transferase n=1 Tax=Dreissena polymorpha TaxID=45954 RepID=A0A9D4MQZ4_DREPO|nr:hypothetical protein DPMN_004850 [Dreissena polymorpha]
MRSIFTYLFICSAETASVEEIMKQFQMETVTSDTIFKILVQRSRVLETALKGLDRKSINFKSKLYIKFSGEMGEDAGGPRQEFFRLAMQNLKSSRYFEGSDCCKIFQHDISALEAGSYRLIGRLVGLSFAHNGPGLHFLSKDLYNLMVEKKMKIQEEDNLLPEEKKNMIKKLREADDDAKKDAFTEMYGDQLLDLGIPNVFLMAQQNGLKLIELIVKHHIYYRISGEISQFCDRMNDVNGAWSMVTTHADLFQGMFCYKPEMLCGDDVINLFQVNDGLQGSNDRSLEDTSIFGWELFLQAIEAGQTDVSFEDLLTFITGASTLPPCVFHKLIDIDFYSCDGRLHSVSTCALQLWLPRVTDPDLIGIMITRACKESHGFLKV